MNISMSDTFNLSWKLAHVLQHKARPDILKTYYTERAGIAWQLLEMDYKVESTLVSPCSGLIFPSPAVPS